MGAKVTDPALLEQLNAGGKGGGKKVTDAAILAQLNGEAPQNGDGRIPILSDFKDFSDAFQTAATEGMTFGFADEINAGLQTPFRVVGDLATGRGFDPGRAYGEGLESTRGYIEEQTAKNPGAALAGDITGSLVSGGGLAKGGLTLMNGAKTLPGFIGRGAAEGAIYGGVSGFGRADGDMNDRLWSAAEGSLWGGGMGAAGGTVAGVLAQRAARAAIPSVDDLKAQAGKLYEAAEARGVTFPKDSVKTLADDVAAQMMSEGIDQTLHPRATAALKRLMEVGTRGMTVKEAQTMRRIIAAAGKDYTNPDEGRLASMMIEKLDDFVASAAPELAQARGIYHQAKKGELIEKAVELAGSRAGQFSGSGFENALRTEFRALERQIIKGQLKGLTPEEVAAITKVAQGGPLENIARYVGKLAPTGVVSFGAGAGLPFAVGTAMGGPGLGAAAAGATMGAGIAGRSAATAMTANNATKAALLARSGGRAIPAAPLSLPQNAVLRALIAAGGNEAGRIPAAMPLVNRAGMTSRIQ